MEGDLYQISINGKKEFNRVLSRLFDGKEKVQVTKTSSSVLCCELGRRNA